LPSGSEETFPGGTEEQILFDGSDADEPVERTAGRRERKREEKGERRWFQVEDVERMEPVRVASWTQTEMERTHGLRRELVGVASIPSEQTRGKKRQEEDVGIEVRRGISDSREDEKKRRKKGRHGREGENEGGDAEMENTTGRSIDDDHRGETAGSMVKRKKAKSRTRIDTPEQTYEGRTVPRNSKKGKSPTAENKVGVLPEGELETCEKKEKPKNEKLPKERE
jgi:hypothetical protein